MYIYIYEVDNGWSNIDDFFFLFISLLRCVCVATKCVFFFSFTTLYVFGLLVTSETACYSVTIIIFFDFMGIFWSVRVVAVLHVRVPGKFFLYPRYGPVKPNQNQPNNSNCTLITS